MKRGNLAVHENCADNFPSKYLDCINYALLSFDIYFNPFLF